MKTVLLINATASRYFRRNNGVWQHIDKPEHNDRLWVIANLSEETLSAFELPLLFVRDRNNYRERKLAGAFPNSQYRAAPIISGNWFKASTAVITGLTSTTALSRQLEKLAIPIAGVWGMSMLLTLMIRRLAIQDVILAIPSTNHLRILAIKASAPVLTRCIQRYREDNQNDQNSDASEILRTRQYLENNRIFEHDALPPVLYLGDASSVNSPLTLAGLSLLALPDALAARGDAAYLHSLFEYVISSPRGQLAPLQLRARHLADNLRRAAYAGIAASLFSAILFGQHDFRDLITLQGQQNALNAELKIATGERERLSAQISASGKDPALVRQATRFSELEIDAAPDTESLLQLIASTIADLPQVRIKNLSYRFPKQGERYCQGQTVIDVPLINRKIDVPLLSGSKPSNPDSEDEANSPPRYSELQFAIMLPGDLAPAAHIEISKRISAALKAHDGVQLMQDPAAFSLINTLKGGMGMSVTQTETLWCMSVPWQKIRTKELP